ncbi:hypothetical protein HK098_002781 [Nowakowskiella sp. JEL0407]|nr:hypothetical protein HK098_002781 [Nowakowskiella sp. JEL0407]
MIQGGDFTKGNGTGGESIYGGMFDDEEFVRDHDSIGLLSMANKGPNTNGSQFFITCSDCHHLDKKHVVFGRVVSNMDFISQIENIPTERDAPTKAVVIVNCGELQRVQKDPKSSTKSSKKKSKRKTSDSEDSDSDSSTDSSTSSESSSSASSLRKEKKQKMVVESVEPMGVLPPPDILEADSRRFLDRTVVPRKSSNDERNVNKSQRENGGSRDYTYKRTDHSGRDVKGRGNLRSYNSCYDNRGIERIIIIIMTIDKDFHEKREKERGVEAHSVSNTDLLCEPLT